ncbi:MAG: phosphonate C-P lyase system protein PhnG [Pseudomonadota bacterium]
MKDLPDQTKARKAWMGTLAKAPEGRVQTLLDAEVARPGFVWLRQPEIGTVMVQGRAGGTGAPFNLGEVTVTRCTLQLDSGEIGHAYLQGRRKRCAEAAALVDALMQTVLAPDVMAKVVTPLEQELTDAKRNRAEKAAATKVDFFTMARGEDA